MLYTKALHIIFMVAWFAGLFYLPRLFVYHAEAEDKRGIERFKIMERRLYYAIIWPAGLLTTFWGILLIGYNQSYYLKAVWMHEKFALVVLLWLYHLSCGHYLKRFAHNKNKRTVRFFRIYNEIPTVLLVFIVLLVVVKPS